MLLDRQNAFHWKADLAGGANNGDILDMKASIDLGEAQIGLGHGGQVPELLVSVLGAKGNADNTLAIVLSGSDAADMSGPTTVLSVTTALMGGTAVAAGTMKHFRIPNGIGKFRYYRAVATTAGTTPAIAAVTIALHTTTNQRSLAGNGLI